jgi:hypothetical protein
MDSGAPEYHFGRVFMSLSKRAARSVTGRMKVVLVLATTLALSGCWVISINPLYEETTMENLRKDPDIVFEPGLIGSWAIANDKCTAPMLITSEDKEVYDFERKAEGAGCTESDKGPHMQGRLVKLGSYYFIDMYPWPDDVCAMCLPKHNIFLTKFDKNSFSLVPIDSDWLKNAIAAKKVKLATLAGDTDTITSSSKDLKAFCRRYAEDKEAFKADPDHGATFMRK